MSDGGIGNPPVIFCKNDSPLYTRGPFTLFVKLGLGDYLEVEVTSYMCNDCMQKNENTKNKTHIIQ